MTARIRVVPAAPTTLIAVPNVSEGSNPGAVERIGRAFAPATLLDVHADTDHGRSVFTLAAAQGTLADGLVSGAAAALEAVDLNTHAGLHPFVGALDVMPVVYLDEERRGAACAEVLAAAGRVSAELEVPVVLYGELATHPERRERAWLRKGGWRALAERVATGEVTPDFGPRRAHPTRGVILATARPPLIAFNLELAEDDLDLARDVAARIRESGGGLEGVRAIGLRLAARGRVQVSTNVHDHRATPLAAVVEAVRRHARVVEAELVGLAPAAAMEGFPEDVPIRGFSPDRHLLENALDSL